jgi:hypothetical protein
LLDKKLLPALPKILVKSEKINGCKTNGISSGQTPVNTELNVHT